MKEHYVSYDCAVKLKELGFSGEVAGKYVDCPNNPTLFQGMLYQSWNLENDEILSPRLDQAQAWLREGRGVEIVVEPRFCNYKRICYDWFVHDDSSNDYALRAPLPLSDTYELALSAGIDAALELLTNKQTDK